MKQQDLAGFLASRRNAIGIVLAVVGVVVALVAGLPIAAVVGAAVVLYVVGAVAGGAVPSRRPAAPPIPAPVSVPPEQIEERLDRMMVDIYGKVPDDVYGRVQSIRKSILATLKPSEAAMTSDTIVFADPNVYVIQQTALSYLPEALQSYLSLSTRDASAATAGRRSPHDLLLEQLDILDNRMREAADALVKNDHDRLEAHGRFLAEKFGGRGLQVPGPGAVVAPDVAANAADVAAEVPSTPVSIEQPAAQVPAQQQVPEESRDRIRG